MHNIKQNLINGTFLLSIGSSTHGWNKATFENNSNFRQKEISYPTEAADVRKALENSNLNLAYLGVKDNKIVITYKTDLETTRPIFDRAINRANIGNIGMYSNGWDKTTFENNSNFRSKKISYPEEAEDVRNTLNNSKGNLAYLGTINGHIIITYKSDLETTRPIFERHMAKLSTINKSLSQRT